MSANRLRRRSPLVAALVYDGLCLFEFSCTVEIFGRARPDLSPHWYRFCLASLDARPKSGQYGFRTPKPERLADLHDLDTLIIPGWTSAQTPVPESLAQTIRALHHRGVRLVSICTGAFVLAAAGILDGQTATTHWLHVPALQQQHPKVEVDGRQIYVGTPQVMTSAGSAAGIDLCLHLVRTDFGPTIANQVARRMVVPPHREGSQAQFVDRPVSANPKSRFSRLLDRIQTQLDQAWPLARMTEVANLSERSLIRQFRQATGTSPGDWLIAARIDQARRLLESSRQSVDRIAEAVGLGTGMTLRHHFRKRLAMTPTAYRTRFQAC